MPTSFLVQDKNFVLSPRLPQCSYNRISSKRHFKPTNGSSPCIACLFVDIFQEQELAGRCGFLPLQSRHVSNHCPILPARTQKQECRGGYHTLQSPLAVAEHHHPSPSQCPRSRVCSPGTQRNPNTSRPGLRSADIPFKEMEELP